MNSKKEKKTIVGLVVSIIALLMFTITMTFAYFTANTSATSSTMTFGTLKVGINSLTASNTDEHTLVPGCTIRLGGTIELAERDNLGDITDSSNIDAFVRMKVSVIPATDGATLPDTANLMSAIITALNNGDWLNVTGSDYLYYAGKFLPTTATSSGNAINGYNLSQISFKINEQQFGNEWQGKAFKIKLEVQAIQAEHVGIAGVAIGDGQNDNYASKQALVNAIAGVTTTIDNESVNIWSSVFPEESTDNAPAYIRGTLTNGVFESNENGEYVKFGNYGGNDLYWRILNTSDLATNGNKALLLSEYAIVPTGSTDIKFKDYSDYMRASSDSDEITLTTSGNYVDISPNNYYFSNVRAFLNGTTANPISVYDYDGNVHSVQTTYNSNNSFMSAFNEAQLACILKTRVYYDMSDRGEYCEPGEAVTDATTTDLIDEDGDYVFILSSNDCYTYSALDDPDKLIRKLGNYSGSAIGWWLRTFDYEHYCVDVRNTVGQYDLQDAKYDYAYAIACNLEEGYDMYQNPYHIGVLPALYIQL